MPDDDAAAPHTDAMQLGLGVELIEGVVHLTIRGTLGPDDTVARVPISPALARFLASQLLGAAKVADPDGHAEIVEAIGREVEWHQVLTNLPPDDGH
jgi:hypothetical protein